MNKVSFYDYRPATLSFRDAVIDDLFPETKVHTAEVLLPLPEVLKQ